MLKNVMVRVDSDEIDEMRLLMRVDASAAAILAAARLGAQVERSRWIAFGEDQESATERD